MNDDRLEPFDTIAELRLKNPAGITRRPDANKAIEGIIAWNEKRTLRVPQIEMRVELMTEECIEANEALHALEEHIALALPMQYYNEVKAHAVKELLDVIFVNIGTLWQLGLDVQDIVLALEILNTSNDSRPVKQLAFGEKGVKGDSFIPAEPDLVKLLDSIDDRNEQEADARPQP